MDTINSNPLKKIEYFISYGIDNKTPKVWCDTSIFLYDSLSRLVLSDYDSIIYGNETDLSYTNLYYEKRGSLYKDYNFAKKDSFYNDILVQQWYSFGKTLKYQYNNNQELELIYDETNSANRVFYHFIYDAGGLLKHVNIISGRNRVKQLSFDYYITYEDFEKKYAEPIPSKTTNWIKNTH